MGNKGLLTTHFLLAFQTIIIFVIFLWGNREDFSFTFSLFSLAFLSYLLAYKYSLLSFRNILIWSIIIRLSSLAFYPQLSEDYLRFYFDSFLLNIGDNPYMVLPSDLLPDVSSEVIQSVIENMNSPDYYSVYPPISQYFFSTVYWLSNGEMFEFITLSKLGLMAVDIGSIYMISKILVLIDKPQKLAFLYAFNPLILIEFSGNMHTEGLAIFFTLAAIYFLLKEKLLFATVNLGFGISVKLLPVLIFPVFIKYLGWKKGPALFIAALFVFFSTFIPFLSKEMLFHFGSSLDLYFRNFEFNAYIYFITREIIMLFYPYNPIAFLGPLLALITTILIVVYSIYFHVKIKKSEIWGSVLVLFILYFAMATTIHPWYISWIILFSIFSSKNTYLILWSYLVYLSYFFYSHGEQMGWWWYLEYSLLTIILTINIFTNSKKHCRENAFDTVIGP